MHFDSDDEGRGGIRNPIVSGVVYLTGNIGLIYNYCFQIIIILFFRRPYFGNHIKYLR